jgi:hypothetical protein
MNLSRRGFLRQGLGVALATALAPLPTKAEPPAQVSESDPQAQALGYHADSAQVDAARFPRHQPSQACAGCALFQGDREASAGPCALFPNRQVATAGWCSAWTPRS